MTPVRAVLSAGRRANELVVVDLPRSLDDGARAVLGLATTVLLVVPNEVRAAAAASRVAAGLGLLCADLRVVARGPSPTGLTGDRVAAALGLPLVADLRAEPGIDSALERTTRATRGITGNVIATITFSVPGPSAATTAIAMTIKGNEMSTSMSRSMACSTLPPK